MPSMATSIGAKPSFRYVMEKPESGQVTTISRSSFERRDHHQLSECQGSRYASQDHAANTAPFSTWRALRTTSSRWQKRGTSCRCPCDWSNRPISASHADARRLVPLGCLRSWSPSEYPATDNDRRPIMIKLFDRLASHIATSGLIAPNQSGLDFSCSL